MEGFSVTNLKYCRLYNYVVLKKSSTWGRIAGYGMGVKRPLLSKITGLEKEKTTENYYKINLREIMEGADKVDLNDLVFYEKICI